MHTFSKCFSCLLLLTISQPGWTQSSDSVTSTLAVSRISAQADGKEIAVPANAAKPGDLLEYVAEYRNAGKDVARKLEATLPIPVGTEYLPGSGRPAPASASLDGKIYEPEPLKRKVKQANGESAEQLVPYSEYRFLRWAARDLAVGTSLKYSARVRLLMAPAPVGAASPGIRP